MNQIATETDNSTAEPLQLSVGTALKAVRESKGIELSVVSSRIKYSVVQLGYLEAENWDRLPKGMPLRGLVRNYAKFLETDVDSILHLLDNEVGLNKPNVKNLGSGNPIASTEAAPRGEPAYRTWAWLLIILVLLCVFGAYAINRGWVPEDWLIFDWLKALRQ